MSLHTLRYKMPFASILTLSLFTSVTCYAERGFGGNYHQNNENNYQSNSNNYHQNNNSNNHQQDNNDNYHQDDSNNYQGNNDNNYHQNDGNNYQQGNNNNYHQDNAWVAPAAVIVGAPTEEYNNPTTPYTCPTMQQCFPNGSCIQAQVCN